MRGLGWRAIRGGLLPALALLVAGMSPAAAQPVFYVFGEDTVIPFHPETGVATALVEISIEEDPRNPDFPTATEAGFSLFFGVDPLLLEIAAVAPTGPLAPICGDRWDFFHVEFAPGGCAGSVTVGVVFGFTCDVFPSYASATPVVRATVETVPGALLGAREPIDSMLVSLPGCGPSAANTLTVSGIVVAATWLDSAVTLWPTPLVPFVRGDCAADGAIDLADAVLVLEIVFAGAAAGYCPAACEMHGDGAPPDIADTVLLLTHLFANGPPPAPPFPFCDGTPGQTPADCAAFPGC